MKSSLRLALWACLWIGASPGISAQENSASIARIYQAVLENSPLADAQPQRMQALDSARRNADRLSPGPLVLEGSYRSDRNFDNQGLRETEIGLSAPMWLWNERRRSQALSEAQLLASEAGFNHHRLELAGQLRQVFWNTLAAQLDVELAQARMASSKQLMEDVQRRVNAGDLARADLLQANVLHAQAQAEHGRALSALGNVGAEFTELTGLPVSMLGNSKHASAEALPSNTQVDIQTHPLYQALQSEAALQSGKADLVAVQRRQNPELGLALVNERAAFSAGNEKSLIVSTRIPLGSSAEHESRLLTARADETEAKQRLKRAETSLKAQASAALANVDFFEQLQANSQEQARLAAQVHAMYLQSFTLGETDLPTLLSFEQRAFEAERMARKSIVEYSAKVSALRQALGLLPEQAP